MTILCGTCAWADHEKFYPKSLRPSERLGYYARYFSIVEVDSSYYKIPSPGSTLEWVRQTPDDFVFDVKAYRTITKHDRGAATDVMLMDDMMNFEKSVRVVRDAGKLGVLLFQFPPWYTRTPSHIDYIWRLRQFFQGYSFAVEFRNRTWWMERESTEATLDLLRDLEAVNVVCDEPQVGIGTIPLIRDVTNPNYVMFRLHGRNGDTWYQKGLESSAQRFDYLYKPEELREFVPIVRDWAKQAGEVHILMNNNQGDYAIRNALDWLEIMNIPHKKPHFEQPTEQLTLFGDLE